MGGADEKLLLFIAANELITAQQAAALLEITEQAATDRLDALATEALVTRVVLSSRLAAGYRITAKGADQLDSALPHLRPLDAQTYRHEIAVAWLYAAARNGRLGDLRDVLSRREMQAADSTLRTESLLDTQGARFKDQPTPGQDLDPRYAYPDLALVQAAGGWATVDVLLTPPGSDWLRTMLGRCHRDQLIRAQLFLVEQNDGIEEDINTAAERLGLRDRVHVQILATDGIAGVS